MIDHTSPEWTEAHRQASEPDYTDMQPSEIDALVAELVMGWGLLHDDRWVCPRTGNVKPDVRKRESWPESYRNGYCWQPSTSIADAWEVVERMVEGGVLDFDLDYTHHPRPLCCAQFTNEPTLSGATGRCRLDSDKLPLAICIAALRARDE